ncbi:MAG: 50S ribosomal protein L22 [Deltaproteobacteria bacterium]|nr:50S ribosomal protein L22 [Deltaproteobacteria bacterium]
MEVKACVKYVRISPRKAGLVADAIRGKRVEDALNVLKFTPKKAARIIYKLLSSALANAEQSKQIDVDVLFVKIIFVDGGPTQKRFMPRAMGRATRVLKRSSHVTIVLDEA